MNIKSNFPLLAATTVAMLTPFSAYAQATAPAASAAPPAGNETTNEATTTKNAYTRTVRDIVGRITEGAGSGIKVVADSSVSELKAPLPDATTPQNFEAQIAALVAALPKGTTWAKLYLPAADARNYKGDDVANYAMAQASLFGTVGAAPAGSVEVMGKVLPADKAQTVIAALDLKPVYVIANPTMKSGVWTAMTDEQKQLYAQKEAQRLLSMDPQTRATSLMNFFGQQQMIMGQMFSQMSPEQRQQFGQTMMQQFRASGGMGMGVMNGGNPRPEPRGGGRNN